MDGPIWVNYMDRHSECTSSNVHQQYGRPAKQPVLLHFVSKHTYKHEKRHG